jgi:hypothetical protein
MDPVIAALGIKALYFLFIWMASAIVASYLSGRKGYGERAGLAFGLILAPIGVLIWLIVPAKPNSDWKVIGVWGRPKVTAEDAAPAPAHKPTGGTGVST